MHKFLPLRTVEKYVPLAKELGVSEVARSPRGFLTAYRKAGAPGNLPPEWLARREAFIKRHMAQVSMRGESLWKDGQPSRRHLALIMWAYSPALNVLRNNPEDPGIDSPAFQRWFKESKVVDEKGIPLVVYHGSTKGGFTQFRLDKIYKHHVGLFFSDDPQVALTYVGGRSKGDPTPTLYSSVQELQEAIRKYDTPFELQVKYHVGGDLYDAPEDLIEDFGGMVQWSTEEEPVPLLDSDIQEYYTLFCQGSRIYEGVDATELLEVANNPDVVTSGVYEVYLSIQDPLVVDAEGFNWDAIPTGEDEDGEVLYSSTNELAREAKDSGHDGVIVHNVHDTGAHGHAGNSTVFVVFRPEQIKSAHGNVGTWDAGNADIRRNPAYGPNELFDDLVEHVKQIYPTFRCKLVVNNEKALAGRTEKRAYAACSGTQIYVATKIYDAPMHRVEGILMHEMAHAILMQMGDHEHSEREADETAEEVFGKRISYDREDVQTTGTGIHPRPLHLEQ